MKSPNKWPTLTEDQFNILVELLLRLSEGDDQWQVPRPASSSFRLLKQIRGKRKVQLLSYMFVTYHDGSSQHLYRPTETTYAYVKDMWSTFHPDVEFPFFRTSEA